MRKKWMECDIHGETLHRCKRRYWKRTGKEITFADSYTEKCFKCISEGRYKNKPVVKKRKAHVRVR